MHAQNCEYNKLVWFVKPQNVLLAVTSSMLNIDIGQWADISYSMNDTSSFQVIFFCEIVKQTSLFTKMLAEVLVISPR